MKFDNSKKMFAEAIEVIPGGVNSPVRAAISVKGQPVFVDHGRGARIYDVDGQSYLDFVASWGPAICGHAPPWVTAAIIEAAKKGATFGAPTAGETALVQVIKRHYPVMEMVRLVSSGTEAGMSVIRLARGYTGRDKILKFQGCYHGHADSLLVAAGSGLATLGIPGCPGIPSALAELTLTVPYNDVSALKEIFERHGNSIAAVIVEPVAGNMGVVLPEADFLPAIRELTTRHGSLFICDEVITGFRLGLGGAQAEFGLEPDLVMLGKIVGGGLPLAAFGGRRDIMEKLAPVGEVYQAGTLAGNPLAVAAGLAAIGYLESQPSIYRRINQSSQHLAEGFMAIAKEKGFAVWGNRVGSMSTMFFTSTPVRDYQSAMSADPNLYGAFWRGMLNRGMWLAPSQFECTFTSAGMLPDEIDMALEAAEETLEEMSHG